MEGAVRVEMKCVSAVANPEAIGQAASMATKDCLSRIGDNEPWRMMPLSVVGPVGTVNVSGQDVGVLLVTVAVEVFRPTIALAGTGVLSGMPEKGR